jgi:hypothetical protein
LRAGVIVDVKVAGSSDHRELERHYWDSQSLVRSVDLTSESPLATAFVMKLDTM